MDRFEVTITATGPGGTIPWEGVTDDKREVSVVMLGKVQTTKHPVLDLGRRLAVEASPLHEDVCGFHLSENAKVEFITSKQLAKRRGG